MTDPSQDTPPSLVERLRKTASHLAAGCVIPAKPHDGSDDPSDPVDDVTFKIKKLRDLASLYATAADALEEKLGEVVCFGVCFANELSAQADPPNRAPLLAALEERLDNATLAQPTAEAIRDAIAAIRTDARVIESSREKLKGWHSWARKLARAEGDEYANAMPATLQARLAGQVEAGQLALLVAPIHRRVELTLALCADMGLGGPEAAELAPKAALWTDAEVAEIEAFRVRDWSGTKVNPFDHLPPALERTIYPGPGGRQAYFKRAGDPLPEPTEAAKDRQLGLPGLPKPETALRLRLALIDKPDSPEVALVAGFAQAMLERFDAPMPSARLTSDGLVIDSEFTMIRFRDGNQSVSTHNTFFFEGLPGIRVPAKDAKGVLKTLDVMWGGEIAEEAEVLQLALDPRMPPADPPSPPGYTLWISMGNSGWALDGVRVADDVIGAWAHHASRWTLWARELAGCTDGTDEELRGFIGRLVARMHAMRTRNITAFDHGTGKPWAPAWEADSMGRIVFYADGRDATVDRLMLRIDADGFGLWVGDRLGVLVEIRTIEEVARLYPLVAPTLADYKADRLVPFDIMRDAAALLARR